MRILPQPYSTHLCSLDDSSNAAHEGVIGTSAKGIPQIQISAEKNEVAMQRKSSEGEAYCLKETSINKRPKIVLRRLKDDCAKLHEELDREKQTAMGVTSSCSISP